MNLEKQTKTPSRFNKTVYWPDWADKSIERFIIARKFFPLSLSDHAIRKLKRNLIYASRAGLILEYVDNVKLNYRNVFEFYIDNTGIRKICHREPFDDLYDIIIIVAETNTIVTVYFNRSTYVHPNLDEQLYEKGE